jgi:hypothetical protein
MTQKMKILYLGFRRDDLRSGVNQKILASLRFWTKAGHEVCYFMVRSAKRVAHPADPELIGIPITVFSFRTNILCLFTESKRLLKAISDFDPDLIYFRYNLFPPTLSPLFRQFNVVVEHNSLDRIELKKLKGTRGIFLRCLNRVCRHLAFKKSCGTVCASQEIASSLPPQANRIDQVIANAAVIDADFILPVCNRSTSPKLLFIGSSAEAWHGIDKLLLLADRLPDADFTVVGNVGERAGPPNVSFVGPVYGDELSTLASQCDVGISTLALHRKQMREASPLKSRQYLTWGLPIIQAYQDTDFPQGAPFILELPCIENNILPNLKRIKAFVTDWKGRRVSPDDLHPVTLESKETERLRFFERILTTSLNECQNAQNAS